MFTNKYPNVQLLLQVKYLADVVIAIVEHFGYIQTQTVISDVLFSETFKVILSIGFLRDSTGPEFYFIHFITSNETNFLLNVPHLDELNS